MAVVTNSTLIDISLAVLLILYFIYWFLTKNNTYWEKRGIPNTKKDQMLRTLLGRESQIDIVLNMYKEFADEKFVGSFLMRNPVLMIKDPALINKILVKDFIHFQDRGGTVQLDNDPLSASLFNLKGPVWRALRYKLAPTFTTGKLRGMFEQVSNSGDNMIDRIEDLINENKEVDCKDLLFQFTLDVIASCAFGLQFKANSPEFNFFKNTVQRMMDTSISSTIRFSLLFMFPKLAKLLQLTMLSTDITQYFLNLTKSTLNYRKVNNIHRNDYFQLLLTLKEQEDSGKELLLTASDSTEDDDVINQMQYAEQKGQSPVNMNVMSEEAICANTFIFLVAGSESVAITISFILLNLAQNLHIQQRIQQEVDTVLEQHGKWSYNAIKDMTYLDQVVQETQRLYPQVPLLMRECVVPYKIPDSDLVIEKGAVVTIPVIGLHKDPQYYPEPDQFNPDRFEGNNFKPSSTFLPFGDGPRICIAMRFAIMEVKTCVARIMSQYTVKLHPKTQTPIKFSRSSLAVTVEGGVWLNFHKRQNV